MLSPYYENQSKVIFQPIDKIKWIMLFIDYDEPNYEAT